MPKTPIDYQNTFIYKLVHKDDLDDKNIYIGHTTHFRLRKNSHKCRCNNPNNSKYNLPIYQYIRENGGWDNWDMLKIEDYPCKDSYEARNRERYWYKELNAKLNAREPNRSNTEWYEENREYLIKKYNQKCICDVCGIEVCEKLIKRHQRSLKCLNAKKNNTE